MYQRLRRVQSVPLYVGTNHPGDRVDLRRPSVQFLVAADTSPRAWWEDTLVRLLERVGSLFGIFDQAARMITVVFANWARLVATRQTHQLGADVADHELQTEAGTGTGATAAAAAAAGATTTSGGPWASTYRERPWRNPGDTVRMWAVPWRRSPPRWRLSLTWTNRGARREVRP